ncbi:hypothetical protein HUZ97_21820 [Cronobacter muytjensii]|nr:hypothetical protein [Cronobacter muytjensii]
MATGQSADEEGSEHALVPEAAMKFNFRDMTDEQFARLFRDIFPSPDKQESEHDSQSSPSRVDDCDQQDMA